MGQHNSDGLLQTGEFSTAGSLRTTTDEGGPFTVPDDQSDDNASDDLARDFANALDLSKWTSGEQLQDLSARLEREVESAAAYENEMAPRVLAALQEHLPNAPDRSVESGVYSLTPEAIARALRTVLFNGGVEACDGTRVVVNTLPVTVVQIGVCLSSYVGNGDGGSIVQRLFRTDITRRTDNAEAQVRDFINRRSKRQSRMSEFGDDGHSPSLSDMLCRALMMYGERAMLADRSECPWRMGHGGPMPHEMLVGAGRDELAKASIAILRRLLGEHKRFIFVPSEISDFAVRTIANALRPLQYAVLRNTKDIIEGYIKGSSYERPYYERSGTYRALRDFQEEVASKVVLCVYRASAFCPGGIFYAHEEHVHEAAQIVTADSALQEHRGFPNLIDVADRTCSGMFSGAGVSAQIHSVLARCGAPFQYFNERATRS